MALFSTGKILAGIQGFLGIGGGLGDIDTAKLDNMPLNPSEMGADRIAATTYTQPAQEATIDLEDVMVAQDTVPQAATSPRKRSKKVSCPTDLIEQLGGGEDGRKKLKQVVRVINQVVGDGEQYDSEVTGVGKEFKWNTLADSLRALPGINPKFTEDGISFGDSPHNAVLTFEQLTFEQQNLIKGAVFLNSSAYCWIPQEQETLDPSVLPEGTETIPPAAIELEPQVPSTPATHKVPTGVGNSRG